MSDPILLLPLAVAIVLIVVGRFNHRRPWGNPVALVGYAVLAVTIVIGILARR